MAIDHGLKERYRTFLATKLDVTIPSAEVEAADQAAADAFYEQGGVWLRQHTRDRNKFPLLFNENVTYGFRRNLLGVKWIALALNLLVVAACFVLLARNGWYLDTEVGQRAIAAMGL